MFRPKPVYLRISILLFVSILTFTVLKSGVTNYSAPETQVVSSDQHIITPEEVEPSDNPNAHSGEGFCESLNQFRNRDLVLVASLWSVGTIGSCGVCVWPTAPDVGVNLPSCIGCAIGLTGSLAAGSVSCVLCGGC
ncbi:hypothetical protein WICPIJ_009800 [Wickerhamomyces pijperi]|uniref:Transmembrane protein n=1 Tax=Wickerhamomyces pijperi TaxID=599730 RepID=A0A9P8PJU8_WICPI|nr:hypothetical protein WICPIJ_009800 [Wickerhamomyces pijperi]